MPMLSFFPWYQLEETIDLGLFELLPYKRALKPVGIGLEIQETIDVVLKPYYHSHERQISRGMLMRLKDKGLIDDLSENERSDAFSFSEIVSLAGLCSREYFDLTYCNSHNFTFVIQSFRGASGGVALTSRRRDGSTFGYVAPGTFKEIQPHHVSSSMVTNLDPDLLKSLVEFSEHKNGERLVEASFGFNRANTDSPNVPDASEVVLMVGAFERILGVDNGREELLAENFCSKFRPHSPMPIEANPRIPRNTFTNCASVQEIWIRDFFRVRGNLAHGRRRSEYRSLWSVNEHLLLGAYAFPLLVKTLMVQSGCYHFTPQDTFDIDVFEQLTSVELLKVPIDQKGSHDFYWTRVRDQASWKGFQIE